MVLLLSVAAVWLHSGTESRTFPVGFGPQGGLLSADIVERRAEPCPDQLDPESGLPTPVLPEGDVNPNNDESECLEVSLRLTEGPNKGTVVSILTVSTRTQPIPTGGGVVLAQDPNDGSYTFADVQRQRPLLALGLLFVLVLVAVARWTGLRALIGLALTILVLVLFMIPALVDGRDALLVSLVGSSLVMLVALYVANGINVQTTIAVLGTLASLLLCGVLAQVFVLSADLTGLGSEDAGLLASVIDIDVRGLLLAGVVLGALGALLDMTVTQASAVWQLHALNPKSGTRELYRAAMTIGRDHVGAATTTLVLAYAGTALPLLVVYQLAQAEIGDVLTSEVVAAEVIRTLIGTIGLVAAVPITTGLAVLTVKGDRVKQDG